MLVGVDGEAPPPLLDPCGADEAADDDDDEEEEDVEGIDEAEGADEGAAIMPLNPPIKSATLDLRARVEYDVVDCPGPGADTPPAVTEVEVVAPSALLWAPNKGVVPPPEDATKLFVRL